MAVLRVLTYPDPFLRRPTPLWEWETDPVLFTRQIDFLDSIVNDLEDTLETSDSGVALAANQCGLPYRLFVNSQRVKDALHPIVVNPEIIDHSDEIELREEGCLSFPGFGMKVRRNTTLNVRYETIVQKNKVLIETTCDGLIAQIFQHETDHLNGRLFVDDLPAGKRTAIAKLMMGRR